MHFLTMTLMLISSSHNVALNEIFRYEQLFESQKMLQELKQQGYFKAIVDYL
jgi:hypothetical protein